MSGGNEYDGTGGKTYSDTSASSNGGKVTKLPHYFKPSGPSTSDSARSSDDPPRTENNNPSHDSKFTRTQSAKSDQSKYEDLLEKQVIFGKDLYTIKGYIPCGKSRLFALECERPFAGYTGRCPECTAKHVPLAESRGFYASVDSVMGALEQKKLERQRLQGRTPIDQLYTNKKNLPPLDKPILGKNKGIEGDSNSCYMDATIFCMFAYSSVFDSLLHVNKEDKSLKLLQKLLRENIVNVLRSEIGFVERDALYYLRSFLSEATGDASFKEMEKDPTEFLRALEGLFQYAPLKTIAPDQSPNETSSNVTTNIMWEMFDANPQNLRSTNIASIFRNSLSEIPAKLATIPPFLILVAPRHTRSQRSYRYIIPNRQISLDADIVQFVCLKCKKTNHNPDTRHDFYSCDSCLQKESVSFPSPNTDAKIICYCTDCLQVKHRGLNEDISNHNTRKIPIQSHKLNLFAVLCIEIAHYVAFVKCRKPDGQHEWLFFDSMSDRIHNEKNIPLVDRVPDFERWIDRAEQDRYFFDDLDRRRSEARPTSQKFDENDMRLLRLFRDGAFFFYENSSVTYQ